MSNKLCYEIFVPGRVCLLGEHSDWVADYQKIDSKIRNGRNIVILLKQGIASKVYKNDIFEIRENGNVFKIDFKEGNLFNYSLLNKFYSYSCGVAYIMLKKYEVSGLKIDIINNNLPIAKGLSSSAAICVLIVKAFNLLYNLKFDDATIMELAYEGEKLCGSKCGKMDQICCLERGIFSLDISDKVNYKILKNKTDIFMLYCDLNSKKDTKKILNALNELYPKAKNIKEKYAHYFFENISSRIVKKSELCIINGNINKLGYFMNVFQKKFDKYISGFCYDELKSPKLHNLLKNKTIKKLAIGAKGVGSQGDGAIQFLVKNERLQKQLYDYLKGLSLNPCKLNIKKFSKIKKAFIPVAGKAERLYPYSKFLNKEFNPVIHNNILKPIICVLLEELYDAGIDEIYIGVSSQKQKQLYREYFKVSKQYNGKINIDYENRLNKIYKCLKFIIIKNSSGFGETVSSFEKYSKGESFILLLGDTLYKSNCNVSCIKQLINNYNLLETSMVGLEKVNIDETIDYGVCFGNFNNYNMKIDKIIEKPTKKYLNSEYALCNDFYRLFGCYILTNDFFEILKKDLLNNEKKENNITGALNKLAKKDVLYGYLINGRSFDYGNINAYSKNFHKL